SSAEPPQDEAVWKTFTAEETDAFLACSGDDNPIHRGDTPVVPGLLILTELLKMPEFHGDVLSMRFRAPVYANDPVCLERAERLQGKVRGTLVFSAAIGEARSGRNEKRISAGRASQPHRREK
ncbi:MAG: MaoC family dehydratase, partial [Clostridiales Family XIII bacterium]|nr:MaoC family dehydratase [Clostridiales Family XIII bacterium]